MRLFKIRIKNKEKMNITQLTDIIVSALQMEDEPYTIEHTEDYVIIRWKHHEVVLHWKYIWFDNRAQYSVYNVINCIKAGN